MTINPELPRILIIDDLFGRSLPSRRNEERANLCGQYLLEDVTGDEEGRGKQQRIKQPIAQVVFHRGQAPACSKQGDIVENDPKGALEVIRKGWDINRADQPCWSLVFLDLCFYTGRVTKESDRRTPGMPEGREGDDDPRRYFGLSLLDSIHREFPDLPVIILSSQSRDEVSQEFSSKGALGFLPREGEKGPELLQEYIHRHGLIPDVTGEIVGRSRSLLLALRAARRAAASRRNILIRGVRGTGKELLARFIHREGGETDGKPLAIVNSGGLTPELYASELFGHTKGSFTGADRDRIGRITRANGGDIFLDEIGNMPLDVQAGLLRAIEYREVAPVGSDRAEPVDVRFLSATNEDIEGRAVTGGFRIDLLDRLREGGTVVLPPLRERPEDIELLAWHFVREAEATKIGALKRRIEPDALELLRVYDWPGNIRELRSVIHNAVFNYPDVEHLVPVHLQLGAGKKSQFPARGDELLRTEEAWRPPRTLEELAAVLNGFSFTTLPSAELAGKLSDLQTAYAGLVARFLAAALKVTGRPTLGRPDGEIFIHPAAKFITGDKDLSGSKAADLIKRLLGLCPEAEGTLLKDPILKEAYETALRLRPRRPREKP